jgi:hypothetical protein
MFSLPNHHRHALSRPDDVGRSSDIGTLCWRQSALILPEGHPLVTDQCSRPPVTRSEELEWDRVAMLCWRDADPK